MESQKRPKNPRKQVLEKAFHKNAKTCRAGFHKKPTKQDGTHMTIRSQITIPTSIFPTTHTTISPPYIPPILTLHNPFNAHPNLQSLQTNPTIHNNKYTHNHSKTTNRELWCVNRVCPYLFQLKRPLVLGSAPALTGPRSS